MCSAEYYSNRVCLFVKLLLQYFVSELPVAPSLSCTGYKETVSSSLYRVQVTQDGGTMWDMFLILFCLFTGLGEHTDAYEWLCAEEDMCGSPQNLTAHEIVRRTVFNIFQCFSSAVTLQFILHFTTQINHTIHHLYSHFFYCIYIVLQSCISTNYYWSCTYSAHSFYNLSHKVYKKIYEFEKRKMQCIEEWL
jgi:hypothetical protein